MPSILYRGFRYLFRRTWNLLNPRAIAWRYMKKRHPNKAITTKLGRDLKVRIYAHDVIGSSIYVHRMFEPADDYTKLGSKTEISLTPNITVFPLSSTRPAWITFPIFI